MHLSSLLAMQIGLLHLLFKNHPRVYQTRHRLGVRETFGLNSLQNGSGYSTQDGECYRCVTGATLA